MNTHELFDALCAQFNPRFQQLRERVIEPEPCALYSSEEERAMTVILTQTLRDLSERPLPKVRNRVEVTPDDTMGAFLGVTGRL